MLTRQNILKAYKTCGESSKTPRAHFDFISESGTDKKNVETKKKFSEVLRRKMDK